MSNEMEPQLLLDALCKDADPRKANSLRLIYSICQEQRDRGSADYSIATIGRLSADRGGPAAGAIRNKTGETYRALIKSFAETSGSRKRAAAGARNEQVDLILEGVTDPVIRARISLMMAELKATRAQLLAARQLANRTAVIDLASPESAQRTQPAGIYLTPLEARALENAISGETMLHWGWKADDSGRVVTDTGRTVFDAGFVTAILKALKNAQPDGM